MTRSPSATSGKETLYAALELSKNSWLLAIRLPDRDNPSLHPIKGGDAESLIAKLDAARQRLATASGCGELTVGSWIRPACRSIGAPVG